MSNTNNTDWYDIKHMIGQNLLDKEERQLRINICESCEFLTKLKVCSKCNCFMPVKTWLKTKKCPAGKW